MLKALPLKERGGILADSSLGWSSQEGLQEPKLTYALGIGFHGLAPRARSTPPPSNLPLTEKLSSPCYKQ